MGTSFDDCVCDGTGGPITEDPDAGRSTPLEPVDCGGPTTGPTIDARCAGKLGLVAGNGVEPDHDVYVATYNGRGRRSRSRRARASRVRGPVTILPVGTSLVATYCRIYSYVALVKLTAGAWSVPSSLGDGSAMPAAATGMTNSSGQLRLFYLGDRPGSCTWGRTPTRPAGTTRRPVAEPVRRRRRADPRQEPARRRQRSAARSRSPFAGSDGTLARETFASGSWSGFTRFTSATPSAPRPRSSRSIPAARATSSWSTRARICSSTSPRASRRTRRGTPPSCSTRRPAPPRSRSRRSPAARRCSSTRRRTARATTPCGTRTRASALPPSSCPARTRSSPRCPRSRAASAAATRPSRTRRRTALVKILRYTGGALSGPYDVGGITKATYVGVGELP